MSREKHKRRKPRGESTEAKHWAAQEVGEVEETEILDKDGKSTGQFRRKATGKGGLVLHGPQIALGESATTS